MQYGAGTVAAEDNNAGEIVDPRPFAVGSIVDTFDKYTHLSKVLPAMGYGKKQMKELEDTINNADVDVVISGTPIDLKRVLKTDKKLVRVRYGVGKKTATDLERIVDTFTKKHL
jgi:predicted GTPase